MQHLDVDVLDHPHRGRNHLLSRRPPFFMPPPSIPSLYTCIIYIPSQPTKVVRGASCSRRSFGSATHAPRNTFVVGGPTTQTCLSLGPSPFGRWAHWGSPRPAVLISLPFSKVRDIRLPVVCQDLGPFRSGSPCTTVFLCRKRPVQALAYGHFWTGSRPRPPHDQSGR